MRSFEQTFRIPPCHRLEQVKTRACGGVVRGTDWDHEEYAATGRLVARYHSFGTAHAQCGIRTQLVGVIRHHCREISRQTGPRRSREES